MSEDYGLIAGISDVLYHQDRVSLSSTGARKVLNCPARFKWEIDNPPAPKPVFDFGKLVHTTILGEGGPIVVVEADNWLTKAAKEQRAEASRNGALAVLASEMEAAVLMRDAVMRHGAAADIFRSGTPELSGYWQDEPTDTRLRFRPDWMTEIDGQTVCAHRGLDIDADPNEFVRSIVKWGYHAQAAWYLRGLREGYGIDARFLFVCVEKTAPYPVSVIELDDEALMEGARRNREAIDLYARCMDTGVWPAYENGITLVNLPGWALPELEIAV